jgi:RNA polymerase sigma-70 factor (ECF subfamily)
MELLQRFAAGDLDAFESLFQQYQREVYRWVMRIVRDPTAAEDLTVEAFWRAHKAHAGFDPEANFAAWLRRIATNLALDHLRKRRRFVELPDDLAAEGKLDSVARQQTRLALRKAFAELPPRLRVVAHLGLVEDESYAEIAQALGISAGVARTRMFRAVRVLRKKLQRLGVNA